MKECLEGAVATFNKVDAVTLLCPGKDDQGNVAAKTSVRWGAAGEQAIAHRLAVYLEREIERRQCAKDSVVLGGNLTVDCEYNRHEGDRKRQRIPGRLAAIVAEARRTVQPDPEDPSAFVITVCPDIVVHERGHDRRNLLVVELKKETNPENVGYDHVKLESFTGDEFRYMVGAEVVAHDKAETIGQRYLSIEHLFFRPE